MMFKRICEMLSSQLFFSLIRKYKKGKPKVNIVGVRSKGDFLESRDRI